jgi:hypothetical protein
LGFALACTLPAQFVGPYLPDGALSTAVGFKVVK